MVRWFRFKTYKDRKDIGTQRKTSDRQQQPTQEEVQQEKQIDPRADSKKSSTTERASKAAKVKWSQATTKPKPKTQAFKETGR